MYRIKKRMEISGAHHLNLPYESKCQNNHGHNWIIEVEIASQELDTNGMVVDFSLLGQAMKRVIEESLDHQDLNKILEKNPTAENMAKWIAEEMQNYLIGDGPEGPDDRISLVTGVSVQETEGNVVIYTPGE